MQKTLPLSCPYLQEEGNVGLLQSYPAMKAFSEIRFVFSSAFIQASKGIYSMLILRMLMLSNANAKQCSGCASMGSMGSSEPLEFYRRVPEPMDFEELVKQMQKKTRCLKYIFF